MVNSSANDMEIGGPQIDSTGARSSNDLKLVLVQVTVHLSRVPTKVPKRCAQERNYIQKYF